jgi:hypothetical protein
MPKIGDPFSRSFDWNRHLVKFSVLIMLSDHDLSWFREFLSEIHNLSWRSAQFPT